MPTVSPFESIGTAINPQERLSARAALIAGGLDFDVSLVPVINSITKQPILSLTDDGQPQGTAAEPICKYFQVVRGDTAEVLGIVEGRFAPLQNRVVFRIADKLVENGARIIRVAEIERGARCFMLVDWVQNDMDVQGDAVGCRAIIQNAHNGKYSAFIRLMPTRRSCGNGLIVPIRGIEHEFRIKHTNGNDLTAEQDLLHQVQCYFSRFHRIAIECAQVTITKDVAEGVLWAIPDFRGRQKSPGFQKKINRIIELFLGGQVGGEHNAVRSTVWGLINAVSEYADFDEANRVRISRGTTTDIQRFKSALSGYSQRLKLGLFESLKTHLRRDLPPDITS